MALKRGGAVREHEAAIGWDHNDVCSVTVTIGDECDAVVVSEPLEMFGMGEVGMRDDHGIDIEVSEIGHAFVDGAIEAAARLPQDTCALLRRPRCYRCVITHDPDIERSSCGNDSCCH
ncbi:unannotated protein [freshwater metagenome]|uniref:Unannotated protein n=1 Tax=freshwater metagenome TaxID=449393 RepID=A0A6J6Y647_9ZZZZ